MDTARISQQQRPPAYDTAAGGHHRKTGILPLFIGSSWMIERNGRPQQFEALSLDLVRAEARKEGRELKMVWRDLSTGKDWKSPEEHAAAYPDSAAMARAGEVHCCAWFCENFADTDAVKKAADLERQNNARKKLCDDLRKKLDSASDITELDAMNARIASVETLIRTVDEARRNMLDAIVGLCSETWHPSHELNRNPGQLAPGTQWTSTPLVAP